MSFLLNFLINYYSSFKSGVKRPYRFSYLARGILYILERSAGVVAAFEKDFNTVFLAAGRRGRFVNW